MGGPDYFLRHVAEYHKYIAISGIRDVKIPDLSEFLEIIRRENEPRIDIQVFNADLVATWEHLYFAGLNALTAFANGDNISRSLAMESMLYVSAQNQIVKARKMLGLSDSISNIALMAIGTNSKKILEKLSRIGAQLKASLDETVLYLTEPKICELMKIYGISSHEVEAAVREKGYKEAVVNIIIEKMALLAAKH